MEARKLLQSRVDVHDRKQFELKLEYQPSGQDPKSEYRIEMFLFLPSSLNVDAENYGREAFYADIHNYVRLKTPVLTVEEILSAPASPLVRLEEKFAAPPAPAAGDVVYEAKLLSCVFRGALRRFATDVDESCGPIARNAPGHARALETQVRRTMEASRRILAQFRALAGRIAAAPGTDERTRASLRLVDEYMSLTVEQFFRKAVTDMDELPRSPLWIDLRKELMAEVIREEDYRRDRKLRSVLSPTGDNEEYMHRVGFLKKFCQNILFLRVRRDARRKGWEEVLFALAAGIAMTFATAIAFWAQMRFAQVSLNFFLILVVGYMMKDRIKEGMRRIFANVASRYLHDRSTVITDPVTNERLGLCKEKFDYIKPEQVPEEIREVRRVDDFVTVSEGELSEVIIRYQKEIVLDADELPKMNAGSPGVTDIIRFNVQRLLRDMDEPEYALEYVDLEDLSVGHIRGAKSYQVDLALRFAHDDADQRGRELEVVRLVLDRNGIKRMIRLERASEPPPPETARSVA